MSSVTIGRIGNASAFWRASSLWAASVNVLALLEDDLAVLAHEVGAGRRTSSSCGSSWATVRLTLR